MEVITILGRHEKCILKVPLHNDVVTCLLVMWLSNCATAVDNDDGDSDDEEESLVKRKTMKKETGKNYMTRKIRCCTQCYCFQT